MKSAGEFGRFEVQAHFFPLGPSPWDPQLKGRHENKDTLGWVLGAVLAGPSKAPGGYSSVLGGRLPWCLAGPGDSEGVKAQPFCPISLACP